MGNKLVFQEEKLPCGFWGYFTVSGGIIMAGLGVYAWFYTSDLPVLAFVFWELVSFGFIIQPIADRFTDYVTIFDYAFNKVIIKEKTVFGWYVKEYPFDEIKCFEAGYDNQIDEASGWKILMEMKSGKSIVLPNILEKNQKACEEISQNFNNYLQAVKT